MNIGILLRNPFQSLVERIHAEFAVRGYEDIRPAHGNVFQFIGKNGARITTMAEKAQMTKQSMSYLVEYLEEREYISRKKDPDDKRAILFCLTDKGRKAVEIAEEVIKKVQDDWEKKLGETKYAALTSALMELNKML